MLSTKGHLISLVLHIYELELILPPLLLPRDTWQCWRWGWLSHLGEGHCWQPVGRGQGGRWTPCMHRESPGPNINNVKGERLLSVWILVYSAKYKLIEGFPWKLPQPGIHLAYCTKNTASLSLWADEHSSSPPKVCCPRGKGCLSGLQQW